MWVRWFTIWLLYHFGNKTKANLLLCSFAGFDGPHLPVCGGRLSAYQLLQLQLLALCGSLSCWAHLFAHHTARQTQARQGECWLEVVCGNVVHFFMVVVSFCAVMNQITVNGWRNWSISDHVFWNLKRKILQNVLVTQLILRLLSTADSGHPLHLLHLQLVLSHRASVRRHRQLSHRYRDRPLRCASLLCRHLPAWGKKA